MNSKIINPFGISPFSILFVAKSRSGKSFVVRYIQYLLKFCIFKSYIFCPTEIEQQFYQKYLNKSKIFLKPDFQKINKIFQKQSAHISFLRDQYQQIQKKYDFKNQFIKFIPIQYFDFIEDLDLKQLDQKITYIQEDQIKMLPDFANQQDQSFINYKQLIVMKNSQTYYTLLYLCVKLVTNFWKNKEVEKVCQLLQLNQEQYKKLNSKKIELIVNEQFQRQNPSIFMVFDDCMKDAKFTKQEEMISIFFEGRHKYISTMLITQQLMRVNKDLRQNFGYIVLSKQQDLGVVGEIQKQYVCEIKEKHLLDLVLHYTKDYGCILIDLVNQSYESPIQKLYFLKSRNLDDEQIFIGSIAQQIQNAYSRQVIEQNLNKPKIKKKEKENQKPLDENHQMKVLIEINKKNNNLLL